MFYIYKHASTHKHTQFPLFFSICFPAEGFQVRLQNRDSLLPGALIPSHQHNVGQHDGKGRRCKYDYYASLFKGNVAVLLWFYDKDKGDLWFKFRGRLVLSNPCKSVLPDPFVPFSRQRIIVFSFCVWSWGVVVWYPYFHVSVFFPPPPRPPPPPFFFASFFSCSFKEEWLSIRKRDHLHCNLAARWYLLFA